MLPSLHFPWITLTLLISFASVNAVMCTPALPDIAAFLKISPATAEGTVAFYLVGYALGQLFYGPLAERFGRKHAIFIGIVLQVLASMGCALVAFIPSYGWLSCCRFLVALGAGVGLKMTFTLVNEWYEPKAASQKVAYLTLAFAITPGLAVGLGGLLNTYLGWGSCFWAGALYGGLLGILIWDLPMKAHPINKNALQLSHLKKTYQRQFSHSGLWVGGLLMGACSCFVYVFAALAPFVAIDHLKMNSSEYGLANLIPSLGMIGGCLASGLLVKYYSLKRLMQVGTLICTFGVIAMFLAMESLSPLFAVFIPMMVIYFGLSLVLPNASTYAMSLVSDKSQGSAVMSFINMSVTTLVVLALGLCSIHVMLLPMVFGFICLVMGTVILTRL